MHKSPNYAAAEIKQKLRRNYAEIMQKLRRNNAETTLLMSRFRVRFLKIGPDGINLNISWFFTDRVASDYRLGFPSASRDCSLFHFCAWHCAWHYLQWFPLSGQDSDPGSSSFDKNPSNWRAGRGLFILKLTTDKCFNIGRPPHSEHGQSTAENFYLSQVSNGHLMLGYLINFLSSHYLLSSLATTKFS